jgi:hypothetical protein
MYSGPYSLEIVNGKEDNRGYVKLKHGQKYKVKLTNNQGRRVDVDLKIDGKSVGLFRVGAWDSVTLERPVNDTGCFTFFKRGTKEYNEAHGQYVSSDYRGLVQATFKPEKCLSESSPSWVSAVDPIVPTRRGISGQCIGSSDFCFASPSSQNYTKGLTSGITGLEGYSDQTFTEVANLQYNLSEKVTLSVRLVSEKYGVRPLRSAYVPSPVD